MTDKDINVPGKPRLAEVLGVEEDSMWTVGDNIYRIHNGLRELLDEVGDWHVCTDEIPLIKIINHPESIIRGPRITEPEIAIMRAVGAKWVSLSENAKNERVVLWRDSPVKTKKGTYLGAISIAYVNIDRFPSVKPGECIKLEEEK